MFLVEDVALFVNEAKALVVRRCGGCVSVRRRCMTLVASLRGIASGLVSFDFSELMRVFMASGSVLTVSFVNRPMDRVLPLASLGPLALDFSDRKSVV